MESDKKKIKAFTDLKVWKVAHDLVLLIYKYTKTFPAEEKFILVSQMKRSVTSITSNIAEGFGRFSYKEKVHFYYNAHGSLIELKNQLIISRDVGYIKDSDFELIINRADDVHRLLQGLIRSSKSYIKRNS